MGQVSSLPWDFAVLGIPISVQAKSTAKERWKIKVATAARAAWAAGNPPLTAKVEIHITFYHESAPLDVDNMIKPIQDALCGIAYVDDAQVRDTHGHLRDLNGAYRVKGMTPAQADGFVSGGPFVHVRIEEATADGELP